MRTKTATGGLRGKEVRIVSNTMTITRTVTTTVTVNKPKPNEVWEQLELPLEW
jgi:preprotein translocase subunit YajC